MENSKERTHADFQDRYRRSSNFGYRAKGKKFEILKNGELSLEQEGKDKEVDA
ncbi:hypothetical protein ACE939_05610 [Aquimarina sp. W85]|uniref:hypothetical protein n=1 Tax=Aquimarina rhodophyticola TaxID=3342246 RepID=UPI003672F093